MIRILDGVPGSGKSYHATELIFADLCAGKTVVTNLPVKWDAMLELAARPKAGIIWSKSGVVLQREQLRILTEAETSRFSEHLPEGTMDCPVEGYFDELQNFFNSRNWSKTQERHGDLLKFVSHHRHYHTNLTLLTQDRANIDKQFRLMCAEFHEHFDLNGWTLIGIGWPFKQFLRKKFVGVDNRKASKVSFVWKDKRIFGLYDSHNKVEGVSLKPSVSRLKLVAAQKTLGEKVKPMIKTWAIIGLFSAIAMMYVWKKLHPPASSPVASTTQASSSWMVHPPGLDEKVKEGTLSSLASSLSHPEPTPLPPQDVTSETLRYAEGDYCRRTDKATYILHRICQRGVVMQIDDDMVTIRQFDGRPLYVLLDGASEIPSKLSQMPQRINQRLMVPPLETPTAPVIARLPEQQHLRQPAWMDHIDKGPEQPTQSNRNTNIASGNANFGSH